MGNRQTGKEIAIVMGKVACFFLSGVTLINLGLLGCGQKTVSSPTLQPLSITLRVEDCQTGDAVPGASVEGVLRASDRELPFSGLTSPEGVFQTELTAIPSVEGQNQIQISIRPELMEDITLTQLGGTVAVEQLNSVYLFSFLGIGDGLVFLLNNAPTADKFDTTYQNWTGSEANDFHIEFFQSYSLPPGGNAPAQPTVKTTSFTKQTVSETVVRDIKDDDGTRYILKRIKYSLTEGKVPAGSSIALDIEGIGIQLASGVNTSWTKDGKVLPPASQSEALSGRGSFTSSPPADANDFHLEYTGEVAGVWVEKGKATVQLSKKAGDKYPHKVDFTKIMPPFEFSVDFIKGKEVQDGASWFTKDGAIIGKKTEST